MPEITPRTHTGVTNISAVPTEFLCHLEETANLQLAAVDHLLPRVIAVSLQPSWQCAFSVVSAAAEVCLCIRQGQIQVRPLVGETGRHPACELLSALVESLILELLDSPPAAPPRRDTTLS